MLMNERVWKDFISFFCGKGYPIRYEYTFPLFSYIFITK